MTEHPNLEFMAQGEALIEKQCGAENDLKDEAIRLWRKDAGRTTPGMAIYSAKRISHMHCERKKSHKNS
ncbi:MAG: hypothetical protein HYV68_00760 [Candidatus Taylorbacteria bacterium]|nr:hypothetical protein [Candidatus Taylorbacteria bacterium]